MDSRWLDLRLRYNEWEMMAGEFLTNEHVRSESNARAIISYIATSEKLVSGLALVYLGPLLHPTIDGNVENLDLTDERITSQLNCAQAFRNQMPVTLFMICRTLQQSSDRVSSDIVAIGEKCAEQMLLSCLFCESTIFVRRKFSNGFKVYN